MSDDSTMCECGHVADEHEANARSGAPSLCTVTGCNCALFEAADTDYDDGDDGRYQNGPYHGTEF